MSFPNSGVGIDADPRLPHFSLSGYERKNVPFERSEGDISAPNETTAPQGREYRIKHDNFNFPNAKSSFVTTSARPRIFGGNYFEPGTYGAMLDGTAYNSLTGSGKAEELVLRGHAVLAFKVEEKNAGYDESVYDPNYPNETRHLYVDDMRQVSFPDYANPYLTRVVKAEALFNADLYYPAPVRGEAVIHTNGDLDVEVAGRSASIRGEKKTGDLPVETGGESGGEAVIYVPVQSGQSIRVRCSGGTNASVQTADTFALITGGATEVTVNADGSVTAKTNGTAGSLAVASDKTSGNLFGTTVETMAPEVTVTPTGSGANVTTNGGTADITVSGKNDSVKFEDVDTSKGVDIKNNGSNSALSSDGQEIAKGTANAGGGTTQNTPAQPTADKQQIGNNAAQKADGNSTQIVDKRKNGGDTVERFRSRHRNVKYSAWAEKEIAIADDFEIIPSALLQKLQGNITRREFAQLVYNTVKAATGMSDADMAKYAAKPGNAYDSQYADPAVAFAYGVGIVSGYEDGSFRPENTFTTEQAVATMLRMFESVVGEKSGYSGGVVTPTNPVSPTPTPTSAQTNTTVPTVEDRDQTGYTPKDWSWTAEGEGYGRKYFTSGKYVRDDGRAVLYIESSDSCDGFSYQLFVMAGGAKQENYEAYDYSGGTSYCWASNSSKNKAASKRRQVKTCRLFLFRTRRQRLSSRGRTYCPRPRPDRCASKAPSPR